MEVVKADVAIIGAGGAGLRAAIALAQADPKLRIALISKVYPMRSHTCAAEGGAAGVIKADDSLEHHFNDTVGGGDWLSDQDAVQYLVEEAPKELIQLEHWGCPWSREPNGSVAVRPFGGMKKQRTWFAADKSGFHILHTLFQTSLQFDSIQRFDEYYATELLVEEGRCAGFVAIEMRSGQMRRFDAQRGDHRGRRRGAHVPVHHQRRDQDRRRHGARLPRRRAAEGHGVRAVPPDRAAQHRHAADRGLPRRGRRAAATRTAAASCRTTAWGRRRRSASRCSRPWSSARATA